MAYFDIRDQVLHLYKTIGNITVLILKYNFLYHKMVDPGGRAV
jgi:hypothetical protein